VPSGLILGRSPNLWIGALTACWGVAVAVLRVDPVVTGLVTAAIGAVVLLVAGSDASQIAAGQAAQARQDAKPNG
jgi:hypothetical protein